jgi:hypothetical protein
MILQFLPSVPGQDLENGAVLAVSDRRLAPRSPFRTKISPAMTSASLLAMASAPSFAAASREKPTPPTRAETAIRAGQVATISPSI